jgi:O-antigen/teichoic acid export membrane protein
MIFFEIRRFFSMNSRNIFLSSMRLINAIIQFFIVILNIRILGLYDAGIVMSFYAVWVLGRTVGSWGYYWVIMRGSARGQGIMRGVMAASVRRVIFFNLVLGVAVVMLKCLLTDVITMGWVSIFIGWLGFSTLAVASLGLAVFLVLRHPVRAVSFELLGLPFVQFLPVAIIVIFGIRLEVIYLVAIQTLFLVAMVLVWAYPLFKKIRLNSNSYTLPEYRETFALWVSDCGTNISLRLPLFLAQVYVGPTAAAVVGTVQQLGTAGGIFSWAAITAAQARLAKAFSTGEISKIRSAMLSAVPFPLIMNFAIVVILMLGGLGLFEKIYGINDPYFGPSILVLCAMAMAEGVFGIGVSGLNLSHRERLSAFLSIAMVSSIALFSIVLFYLKISPIMSVSLSLSVIWTLRALISWIVCMAVPPYTPRENSGSP